MGCSPTHRLGAWTVSVSVGWPEPRVAAVDRADSPYAATPVRPVRPLTSLAPCPVANHPTAARRPRVRPAASAVSRPRGCGGRARVRSRGAAEHLRRRASGRGRAGCRWEGGRSPEAEGRRAWVLDAHRCPYSATRPAPLRHAVRRGPLWPGSDLCVGWFPTRARPNSLALLAPDPDSLDHRACLTTERARSACDRIVHLARKTVPGAVARTRRRRYSLSQPASFRETCALWTDGFPRRTVRRSRCGGSGRAVLWCSSTVRAVGLTHGR